MTRLSSSMPATIVFEMRKEERLEDVPKRQVTCSPVCECAQERTGADPGQQYSACSGPRNRGAVMRGVLVNAENSLAFRKQGRKFSLTSNGRAISRNGCEFFNGRRTSASAITRSAQCAPRTYARVDARSCHAATLPRLPAHTFVLDLVHGDRCEIFAYRHREPIGRAERSRPKPRSGATKERP